MKRLIYIVLVFLILTGMGGIGGEDESKLPRVTENYTISLTDADGYTAKLSQVSISEGLFLSGNIGKGKHIVNFSEIQKINLEPINEKEVEATVYFNDGTSTKLITNGKSKLKGKSKYGIFIISLRDVKEIKFLKQ